MHRGIALAFAAVAASPTAAHSLTSIELVRDKYGTTLRLRGDRHNYCGGCVFRPLTRVDVGDHVMNIDVGDLEPEHCFAAGQPWAADVKLPPVPDAHYELRVRDVDAWSHDEAPEPPLFGTLWAYVRSGSGVAKDGFESEPGPDPSECNF